jgi:hypothetical protein
MTLQLLAYRSYAVNPDARVVQIIQVTLSISSSFLAINRA